MLSVINISLLDQGKEGVPEQENLTFLPTKAGTTLAKAPRPASNSLPNSPLPPSFPASSPSKGPRGGETKAQVDYKGARVLLLLPLTEPVFPQVKWGDAVGSRK